MNHDLWKAIEKQKTQETHVSSTYLDELRARGASEESLVESKKMMDTLKGNTQPMEPILDDDDDGLRVIPMEKTNG